MGGALRALTAQLDLGFPSPARRGLIAAQICWMLSLACVRQDIIARLREVLTGGQAVRMQVTVPVPLDSFAPGELFCR